MTAELKGIEIHEYVTPHSKRAAILVSTLCSVYVLHTLGIADLSCVGRLPITSTPINGEFAPHLFYWLVVLVFAMWGLRYDAERRYQGSAAQSRTLAIRNEIDHNIKNDWRLLNLKHLETQLKRMLVSNPRYEQYYTEYEEKEFGFQIWLSPNNETNPLIRERAWKDLDEGRKINAARTKKIQEGQTRLNETNNIEFSLSFHSRLNYEFFPIFLFLAAIFGELASQVGLLPLLSHSFVCDK